ncbi:F-box/LRR-repeat MAX2 homolog A [Selaginella moellendorffii]|nr:F-box/LRR-repeat MAX2 homolog A [Selaginella moellendorffii]|eukprot:XP_002968649.2 F-box/LRR-repeat MAX2 homolog A [Selaginella moellendorffii]
MEIDFCSRWDGSMQIGTRAREEDLVGDGGELDLWMFSNNKRQKTTHGEEEDHEQGRRTALHDIPGSILAAIIALVPDTRSRNAASLVCKEWHAMERATRRRLCLRGSSAQLHMLPTTFHAVRHLDVSNVSPWGTTLYAAHSAVCGQLTARWLNRAFPSVVDLTVYARDGTDIQLVAASWPDLETVRLVRWHQRPTGAGGDGSDGGDAAMELRGLLSSCPRLTHLDLSRFYCWAEDIAPALQASPSANLRVLNLLKLSPEGFKAAELLAIAAACGINLEELYALCEFDPRFLDCLSDECLIQVADYCPHLRVLHLVDSTQFSASRDPASDDPVFGAPALDASVTVRGLESLFQALPLLEDLALLLGHKVRDSAPAFEALAKSSKSVHALHLGHFQGLCSGSNGIARCGAAGLRTLQLRSCDDLTDAALGAIASASPQISWLGLRRCPLVTPAGLSSCVSILRRSLTRVEIECCPTLSTRNLLRALAPVRSTLQHLHVDCVWDADLEEEEQGGAEQEQEQDQALDLFGNLAWKKLHHLSLWISAAHLISPLVQMNLISHCPLLRELSIRVEGDCRLFAKPQAREFGLRSFARFPSLASLRLDLSEAVGYALSAPGGNRDLSIWERFYLQGIQSLPGLQELDYFPPSDKDVNYRGMTLPGVGLISQCHGLRKLFVHGTAYEHLFMMLLKIYNLRDVQLRADYFPAPDMETSTEMRAESCKRFETLLEKRGFPD